MTSTVDLNLDRARIQPRMNTQAGQLAQRMSSRGATLWLLIAAVALLGGCATRLTPRERAEAQSVLARINDPAERDRATDEAKASILHVAIAGTPKHERTPPAIRVEIKPTYPFELRRGGVQGLVWVAFEVTTDGNTADVRAVGHSDRAFVKAAVSAVSKWKFRPATDNGQPVSCRLVVPIAFTLVDPDSPGS
jgi:protein TonB